MVSDASSSQNITSYNTLILGGSFNPIHHGHLICARTSAEILGFEKVLLIPSGQPPHKQQSNNMASAADRLAMCRRSVTASLRPVGDGALVGNQCHFDVSEIETAADGPSYTLTTTRRLRAGGIDKINWLIGADQLNALPSWHQPRELLEEVHFVVMARPGYELHWEALPDWMRHLQANVVEAPRLDISATDIRRRVAAGRSIDWLTPAPVVEYIHEHGLYRLRS